MFRTWRQKLADGRYRRRIRRALSLRYRGGVRNDELTLINLNQHLYIEWQAREIHPWDGDLAIPEKKARLLEQCMEDTETAILRLFDALPEVNAIDIRVREPGTEFVVFEGRVVRTDLDLASSLPSIRMRLRTLGIAHHLPIAG